MARGTSAVAVRTIPANVNPADYATDQEGL